MQYNRARQVASRLDISESTVWRWAKAGKLPKPIKLSNRVTVFNSEEVDAAIEALGGAV
ncbi:AlpA family phage regulatory protein [Mariprofundus sp. EBB-1]|uniref:helix-turn-helix transcriptional regulator n=1 Tax=Mariprofundus sp. EBB-1 TaxID=2650971 RepID=UPI000EF1BC22|nr:AlpA family phage regulatory protein [Mariprofundus sp. EBB-1]RLL52186.1 AlpA family phage regulatory protein [Mariprofundus sp. EBB-1]